MKYIRWDQHEELIKIDPSPASMRHLLRFFRRFDTEVGGISIYKKTHQSREEKRA